MQPETSAARLNPRRSFLKLAAGAACALAPTSVLARTFGPADRSLSFESLHTGEKLKTVYWTDGSYLPDAMRDINKVLRDHRTGDIFPMEPTLMDILSALDKQLGGNRTFQIISGYRSPQTNSMLVSTGGGGVAKKSLHMLGQAIDIRVPGVELAHLRQTAIDLGRGGVGYYPSSDFVHVDVGRVRCW